ncbi:hypothetical protein [Fodinicola feengrottensis]|nr:hypothetical protein [Fodinicola feengrottensis]
MSTPTNPACPADPCSPVPPPSAAASCCLLRSPAVTLAPVTGPPP